MNLEGYMGSRESSFKKSFISQFKNTWWIGVMYVLINTGIHYKGINIIIDRANYFGFHAKVDYVVEVGNIIFDKNYINICILIFLAYLLIKNRENNKISIFSKLLVGVCFLTISFLLNMITTWIVYAINIHNFQGHEFLNSLMKSTSLDFIINIALLYIFMYIHSFYRKGFIAGIISWAFTVNIESIYYILCNCKILKGDSSLINYLSIVDISKYNWESLSQMPVQIENLKIKVLTLGCFIILAIVINYLAHIFDIDREKNGYKCKVIKRVLNAAQILGFILLIVDIIEPSVGHIIYYFAEWDLIFIISSFIFYVCVPKVSFRVEKYTSRIKYKS